MKKTMPQYKKLQYNHIELLDRFSKGFLQVYRYMEPDKRIDLLDLAPLLFQKWYSSALVQNTILSPANMISSDKGLKLLENEVFSYNLTIDKNLKPGSNFSYSENIYTSDNHPLVYDIKTILEYCQPDIPIEDSGAMQASDIELLLPKLSQQDTRYLEYLLLICHKMGFFSKLSSIHSSRMQSVNFEEFLTRPNSEQLSLLAHAAVKLAADEIQFALRLGFDFMSEDFFMPYLESTQDVDEIFIDIFRMLDVDITETWENAETGNVSFDDAAIMSSYYYMGVLLDKWLITPMSFYFHCLQPLHYTPFSFINSINNLTSLLIMETETDMELYTPCSSYFQTPIGKAIFGTRENEFNEHLIPEYIEFPQLIATVDHELRQEKLLNKKSSKPTDEVIYSFKVKFTSFKRKWKILEVFARANLEAFCDELCGVFNMDDVMDYTLTVWDHNQFPVAFSPENSKRAINKTHTRTLESLSLEVGDRMLFAPIPDKNKQLELELTLLKVSKNNPFIIYPRIKKQSTFITEAEKMEDLF